MCLCLFPGVADMEAGRVGLALSYAVTLIGMFQWGVRQSAEVENMVRTLSDLHHEQNVYRVFSPTCLGFISEPPAG